MTHIIAILLPAVSTNSHLIGQWSDVLDLMRLVRNSDVFVLSHLSPLLRSNRTVVRLAGQYRAVFGARTSMSSPTQLVQPHLVTLVLQSKKALQHGEQLCSRAHAISNASARTAVDVVALDAKVRWVTEAVSEQLTVCMKLVPVVFTCLKQQ